MRFDKGHKAATRKRIVAVASERFRRDGVSAVGIAGLMADAGLTHGGFYAHFDSKEDLLREALVAASAGTGERLARAAAEDGAGLAGIIRYYLRPAHRDKPAQGCVVAALAPEIARQPAETRAAFSARLAVVLGQIAAQLPAGFAAAERDAAAIGIFGVMVGTLQLSRAVADPELSGRILESGVAAALRLGDVPRPNN